MLRLACGEQAGAQVGFNAPDSTFAIETEHFSGRAYVRLRGLADEPSAYFAGKKRQMSTVVQGRFKRAIPMMDCATGYEFDAPFTNLPIRMVIKIALSVVRAIAPTASIDLLGDQPSILNPLFQTVQRLHVAVPGEEPDITAPLTEQTTLLGGVFAERGVAWERRKKMFASRSTGGAYTLDPALVYTFELYEDKFVPPTFDLTIAGYRFPLARFMGGGAAGSGVPPPRPLQQMGKVGFEPHSQDYIFNVELWHESLFPAAAASPDAEGAKSPIGSGLKAPSSIAHKTANSSVQATGRPSPWITSIGSSTSSSSTASAAATSSPPAAKGVRRNLDASFQQEEASGGGGAHTRTHAAQRDMQKAGCLAIGGVGDAVGACGGGRPWRRMFPVES